MVRVDRITARPRRSGRSPRPRAGLPLALGHALIHSPHDSKVILRGRQHGLPVARSRPLVDRHQPGPDGQREARRHRDDGREEQRHADRAQPTASAAWPAIVSLAESPKAAGPHLHRHRRWLLSVTKDAGKTWTNVFGKLPGVPAGIFVVGVVPSRFDENTVYATFDGHRQNDFGAYIYASNDAGGRRGGRLPANLKDEVARTSEPKTSRTPTCSISAPRRAVS